MAEEPECNHLVKLRFERVLPFAKKFLSSQMYFWTDELGFFWNQTIVGSLEIDLISYNVVNKWFYIWFSRKVQSLKFGITKTASKKRASPPHSFETFKKPSQLKKSFKCMPSQWKPRSLYTHQINCTLHIYFSFLQKSANIKAVFVFLYCSCLKEWMKKKR